ncbi:MAG: nitrous oxide-stimulated promoter family protein [Smithellaceae bacterium]|nr:nitrous oxide-stimulated promoter family protein [Smithellaceae bacterium]
MPPHPSIANEHKTIAAMISLYCRERHRTARGELCPSCADLLAYAQSRLEKCPFAADKPTCSACPVHCYKPERRRQIQDVMRYAGPRMMRSHPLLALRHLLKKFKKPKGRKR